MPRLAWKTNHSDREVGTCDFGGIGTASVLISVSNSIMVAPQMRGLVSFWVRLLVSRGMGGRRL